MNEHVRRVLKPEVLGACGYSVPSGDGLIKLDAMELPWRWPPDALRPAWVECLSGLNLSRYPDAALQEMDEAVRHIMAIPDSLATLYGNGSDELIQILLLALPISGGGLLSSEPTFVMYRHIAGLVGLPHHAVDLQADFSLDVEAMLTAMDRFQPGLIILASPNNPTGTVHLHSSLLAIIENAPGLVMLDEAYFPYVGQALFDLVQDHRHVLVLRTVSKCGLAGLRVGVLIGDQSLIRELDKIRLPYNISSPNQASLCFMARHWEVLQQQIEVLRRQRDTLYQGLQALPSVTVWPSKANFFLFRSELAPAPVLYQRLLQAGILVKDLHSVHALLDHCLRVTVGNKEENEQFLSAMRRIQSDLGVQGLIRTVDG